MMFFVMPCVAEQVQPETARRVAQTFLNSNRADANNLVDVSAEAGFPNLYIFTTEHSFVIMSANNCVQPVLGYSLTGGVDVENMPLNMRDWLQGYSDEIQYTVENSIRCTDEISHLWEALAEGNTGVARATTVVNPLIQTKWNQDKYYNNLCPVASGGPDGHAYAGCTATSMAQIMKYYNYPSRGIGSHSYTWNNQTLSADFGATTYDWNNMDLYYNYYYDDNGTLQGLSTPSSVTVTAVATLMYHCGVSVNMNYSASGSGANLVNAANAWKLYFNYSSDINYQLKADYSDDEWKTMLKNELNAGRPLQYEGRNSNNGGHAFVCDGYNNSDYFHFNWGWSGYCDGYFSIGNLNPNDDNYSIDQGAVFGIRPSNNNATPTNLTYTQNGRNVTLHWSTAGGAASYNIYRDMNLVGNVTSNSYTEAAPYGNSVYYVRSVNSAGELSLSTNSVSVTVAYPIPMVDDLSASVSGNDVSLSWTAPEWCYPETPSATLNYGDATLRYRWTSVYYAHRYLAANLAQYANKAVYKVSTYVLYPGDYTVYIYTNTSGNQPVASSLAVTQTRHCSCYDTWLEFCFDTPIIISGTNDLWVVMKQENTGQDFPTPSFDLSSHNINAFYSGNSPTSLYDANSNYNCAWFINTYLTDGTYTYNIYRNGSSIANHVSNTSYNDNNLPDGIYTYYVKTNYYAGETAASNSVTAEFNVTWYTISTSCDPTNGGTASGGGSYYNGQSCTLTATPATNYTFVNWTKNGTQVSTNPTYTFNVTETANYVAHFTYVPPTYTITVSANPANGGNVTGGGTIQQGQPCTVVATPNANYTFNNWTENGNVVSTNASYTFTVNANRTLVANFTYVPPTYTISVSANPSNGGNVTGGGTYQEGLSCTVSATPATNYTFTNWTENGNVVSTNASYTFAVTGDRTLVANFTYVTPTYTITVSANPSNGGNVTGGGTIQQGQSCTVVATPNTNYTFNNWTENGNVVSTNASYTFTVNSNRTLVANFTYVPPTYTITVSANPSNGGNVTGGGTIQQGQSCTVVATPNTNYTFNNWTENGNVVSTNASYTFTVNSNRTLVANFTYVPPTYTITVSANPSNGGNVTGGGTIQQGQSCTVVATPNTNYTFNNWTENGNVVSTNASYTFTVNANRTLVANFTYVPPTYTITVSANPTNGGNVTGGGTYQEGQSCTVHATANTGYTFVNWTANGTQASTSADYTFIVTGNLSLVAHFSASNYIITALADPEEGGVVSGSGGYNYGDQCTLTATANQGYTFVNWTKNGVQVSTNTSYTFTVTESATYIAHFQAQSYTITVSADPTEGGTVTGDDTFTYGQSCTVHATANTGYNFVNWTENGTQVSTDADYTFTVTGDRSLVAHFEIVSFMIDATTDPDNGGSIMGIGSYDYGQTCTLSIEPYENYTFIHWTENGVVVSEEQSFSFTVEESHSFVAHLSYYDGVDDNHAMDIDIYPTPVTNTLTVTTSQPVKKWEVFSASGTKLYSLDECANMIELPVRHLAPGIYMIRMTTNNAVFTRKFVKK